MFRGFDDVNIHNYLIIDTSNTTRNNSYKIIDFHLSDRCNLHLLLLVPFPTDNDIAPSSLIYRRSGFHHLSDTYPQVIGHEITHGFDDQGRQHDKDGNVLPWWTNKTLQAFQSRAQCIVDQYGSISLPELDKFLPNITVTLNGINTLGENIADNGGLRQAFLAYQLYVERYGEEPRLPGLTEYSPMQLFFLQNANIWCKSTDFLSLLLQVITDPHTPEKFRVLVPMSNMKEFSDIWNCPVGSGMNPKNKCQVW
ncbi:Neprilysin-11 [Portunus trituberculatus]|uniref:Neprilysin-11 n=1 Tax=Portunus trituberculatus TaxID=210409 RepID=A0A5B7GDJ8_PORTR|nr:Neprilysin-11 [Portunus trituberculatus]